MFEQELISAKYLQTEESIFGIDSSDFSQRPSKFTELLRTAIVGVILVAAVAGFFFLLPVIQSLLLPNYPGGIEGPWVIRPALMLRYGACIFFAFVLVPLTMFCQPKSWGGKEPPVRTEHHPIVDQPFFKLRMIIVSTVVVGTYAACLLMYLHSWVAVTPAGIETRGLWRSGNYSFDEIRSLQLIPRGMHSKKLNKHGPWYKVEFVDGRDCTFAADSEGTSDAELTAVAMYIAKHAGHSWNQYPDARPFTPRKWGAR